MNTEVLSLVITGASKIVGQIIRSRSTTYESYRPGSSRPASTIRPQTGEIVNRGVSTADTITYQKEQLVKQITLMEMHLTQGCKIMGKACDCCEKHPEVIEALAEETIGMTGDRIYQEIIDWCEFLKPRTSADASASGKYDKEYAGYALEGRRLRKALMGSAIIAPVRSEVVGLAKQVPGGQMTREEAVARIKEIAAQYGHT